MKILLNFINLLCIAIVLFVACSVNEGIYGKWRNISAQNFFGDTINIVKLRAKDGANFPYYTMIYDDNFHASVCQRNREKQDVCLSFLLKTTHIHPTDEISSVIAAPLDGRDYLLNTKFEHHLGYNLLYWEMTFPQYKSQKIVQTFRREWF